MGLLDRNRFAGIHRSGRSAGSLPQSEPSSASLQTRSGTPYLRLDQKADIGPPGNGGTAHPDRCDFRSRPGVRLLTVPSEKAYTSTATVGIDESSTSFQDVKIIASQTLEVNQDYYLYLKIPQDMNYDMAFNIKLMRQSTTGTGEMLYQFLKSITIPKGGTGNNVYNVALYGIGEYDSSGKEKVAAMIPLKYVAGAKNVKGSLYVDNNNNYYLGNGNNTYTPTTHVNDLMVAASWIHELGENFGYAELVFRPVEGMFTDIVI